MLLALMTAALAQPCPEPTSGAQLAREIDAAEQAWGQMDLGAFTETLTALRGTLTCLDEALTPVDAAAYHRVEALAAFASEDRRGTVLAFRASLDLQPNFELPEAIAPLGNPLREQYEAAKLMPPSPGQVLYPEGGSWMVVDGTRSDERPTERPTIVQRVERGGEVSHSAWLPAWSPTPDWASGPAPDAREPREDGDAGLRARRTATVLLGSAAGCAVAGGSLYGYAWGSRATYFDPTTPFAELEAIRRRTNGAAVSAAVLGGVAVGAGVGAALVLAW